MLIEIDLWTSYAANTCLDGETHAGRRSALRAVVGSFGITESVAVEWALRLPGST